MKKYLIIGDAQSPHITKWAKELSKHFELYLVSSRGVSPEIRQFIPDERIFSFNLKMAESGQNYKYFRIVLPLKKIIRRIKPDYVNAHYVTSHGFVAALARKFSSRKFILILTAWGTDILVTPFKSKMYKKITRFALNQASLVTTDSLSVAEIVHDLSPVPTSTFPFGLNELPEASAEDKDTNLFYSNRTLNANSNIDRVLHLFSGIRDQNSQAKLVIANDGPMREKLIQISGQLNLRDAVEFVGFVTEQQQNDFYKKAQFYLSLLTSDALSVSLLEAMSYGCIPILSDLPDNRDWVTDGVNGIILQENKRIDTIMAIRGDSMKIYNMNREMVSKKAIFPRAIEEFCITLSTL